MTAISLADKSVTGRSDTSDRLPEWGHKITCQLTPGGPSQEEVAQPFSTLHSQFPGTMSQVFRINSSIFGTAKTHHTSVCKLKQTTVLSSPCPKGLVSSPQQRLVQPGDVWDKEEIQKTRGEMLRQKRVGRLVCECQLPAGFMVALG